MVHKRGHAKNGTHREPDVQSTLNVDPVMSYLGGGVKLLTNPSVGNYHNRNIGVNNIIASTTEGAMNRTAMAGIIETSVPPHMSSGIHKAKATATQTALGMRHIPGSTY